MTEHDAFNDFDFEVPDVPDEDTPISELHARIHRLTVEALIKGLQDPATATDAAFLNAALRFMKDYNIEADPAAPGSGIKDMETAVKNLPFRKSGT